MPGVFVQPGFLVFMARQAGLIRILGLTETPAGSMAKDAFQFARAHTGGRQPGREGKVFPQVASVWIVILIFQQYQIKVVKKSLARAERIRDGRHFRMTRGAGIIALLAIQVYFYTNDFQIRRRLSRLHGKANVIVGLRRPVARFAVDARFAPYGAVAIGCRIIIGGQLTDMAGVAGGVEGVGAVAPVEAFAPASPEVGVAPRRAVCNRKPLAVAHVKSQRQGLQAPALKLGKKIINVFAAKHLSNCVVVLAVRASLAHKTLPRPTIGAVNPPAGFNAFILRGQLRANRGICIGLHGQPVAGCGPEGIKFFVAALAALRTGKSVRGICRKGCVRPADKGKPQQQGLPASAYILRYFQA